MTERARTHTHTHTHTHTYQALHMLSLLVFTPPTWEVIMVSILQMRKLRPREVCPRSHSWLRAEPGFELGVFL